MDFKISGACLCVYAKYMYIYVCMYVCMYVCKIHKYTYTFIWIHMYIYICIIYVSSPKPHQSTGISAKTNGITPRQGPEWLPRPKRSSESSPEKTTPGSEARTLKANMLDPSLHPWKMNGGFTWEYGPPGRWRFSSEPKHHFGNIVFLTPDLVFLTPALFFWPLALFFWPLALFSWPLDLFFWPLALFDWTLKSLDGWRRQEPGRKSPFWASWLAEAAPLGGREQ